MLKRSKIIPMHSYYGTLTQTNCSKDLEEGIKIKGYFEKLPEEGEYFLIIENPEDPSNHGDFIGLFPTRNIHLGKGRMVFEFRNCTFLLEYSQVSIN